MKEQIKLADKNVKYYFTVCIKFDKQKPRQFQINNKNLKLILICIQYSNENSQHD